MIGQYFLLLNPGITACIDYKTSVQLDWLLQRQKNQSNSRKHKIPAISVVLLSMFVIK